MNPEIVEQMEKDYMFLSKRIDGYHLTEGEGIAMAGIARALMTHYITLQVGGN